MLNCFSAVVLSLVTREFGLAGQMIDLAGATVVTRAGPLPKAEQTAAQVLVEELEKRIGKRLPVETAWPKEGLVVVVMAGPADEAWGHAVPKRSGGDHPEARPEGYRVFVEGANTVWVVGADGRGTLFGVGRLLRTIFSTGTAGLGVVTEQRADRGLVDGRGRLDRGDRA